MIVIISTIPLLYFHSHSFWALILNIIIFSISHNNMMSFYGFFCLNTVTKIIRGALYISYCDNIKTWMKYCACWKYDSLLQLLLLPIPIGFYCLEQRYCALTTNSPAEINCPSIVALFCIGQYQ